MPIRILLTLFAMLFLTPDPGGNGNDDPPENDEGKPDDKPEKVTFDDKQQAAINAMLAKERKDAEERTAQRLKDEAKKADEKAKEQRERDEAEKRGEFEKVKQDLEGKLQQAEADRDAAQERLDEALKVIRTTVTKAWDDAPEEVRDLYDGEDDPLAKQAFLSKPATAKLIERLTKTKAPHIPRDPKPGGPGGPGDDTDAPSALPKSKLF